MLSKVKSEAAAAAPAAANTEEAIPGQTMLKKTAGSSGVADPVPEMAPKTEAAKASPLQKVVPGMTELKPGEKGSAYNLSAGGDRQVGAKKGRTIELEVSTGPKPSEENLEKFRLVNEKQPDDQSSFFLMVFLASALF